MSKKLLLELPNDVHNDLKEYQIDLITETRKHTSLNELLIELIKSGTARVPVNETATGILRRAALKKTVGQSEAQKRDKQAA